MTVPIGQNSYGLYSEVEKEEAGEDITLSGLKRIMGKRNKEMKRKKMRNKEKKAAGYNEF